MKVGIISMQRVYNHGSFLQSYGLKSLIESLGHEVRFVDIKKGEKIINASMKLHSTTPLWYHILRKCNHMLFNLTKYRRFEKQFFTISDIDKPVVEKECDFVVIGSDEVFNCIQASSWGFTDQLFGKTEVPAISYAGSFGSTTYKQLGEYGLQDRVKRDMECFRAISVRDQNSYDCVTSLLGINPLINLDPVLIYDFRRELETCKKTRYKNYIAIYSYDNSILDPNEVKIIKEFARKKQLKIISLGFFTNWCDYNLICSPFELLSYFCNATYVITDTFHGAVISIKENKNFVAIVRERNKNKLGDLLRRFKLVDRQLFDFNDLEKVLDQEIEYEGINAFIEEQKNITMAYLKENLK